MENFKWIVSGGLYIGDHDKEFISYGGSKCYEETTVQFRIALTALSAIINLSIMYCFYSSILQSQELNLKRIKRLSPNLFEKFIGLCHIFTLMAMIYYKSVTGRLAFILNPCHVCLLLQGYLLLTKKTKFSSFLYISTLRWTFGPWLAFVFPDLEGLDLPFELEFFYIEHYLAAFIGVQSLIIFGRYGYHQEGSIFKTIKMFFMHQFYGFAIHSLHNRLIAFPISLLTWCNINYNLCHPTRDPIYPIIGDYYLYFVDHYLNLASLLVSLLVLIMSFTIRYIVINLKIIENVDLYDFRGYKKTQ